MGWVGLVLEEGLFKTKAVNEEEEGFGWEGMIIKNTVNMVDTEEGFVCVNATAQGPRALRCFFVMADPLQKYVLEWFCKEEGGTSAIRHFEGS